LLAPLPPSVMLNSVAGARLIEAQTGRRCSRQNLEKLCDRGALQGSRCVVQLRPLRLDPETLVGEFLALVAPDQAEAVQPRQKRPAPPPVPAAAPGALPQFTQSRARCEHERANLLELERRAKEAQLLRREDADEAWNQAMAITRARMLEVVGAARRQLPRLDDGEVMVIESLIREALVGMGQ
jgi:hypothetical protein